MLALDALFVERGCENGRCMGLAEDLVHDISVMLL
jgi:hypothetical protein